ncbi:MAG: single-stranded-DNA-specific exonuclease RecJ [Patescibacteria group bacterium]
MEIRNKNSKAITTNLKQVEEILLENRAGEDVEAFLNPPHPYSYLDNPKDIFGKFAPSLEKLEKLIQKAIEESSPIIVHGDYDVDGITATAILWELIYKSLGHRNCLPFIPNRFEHGYGLTKKSIDAIAQKIGVGAKPLLIAIDCGITAVDEVAYAKSLGFTVAIIDHHELPKKLPDAKVILHTLKLCSGGIAYMLSSYIHNKSDEDSLDLATLATIADLQPLLDINRSIVKYGLPHLSKSNRVGIKELIKVAGIENKIITPYEVGWIIGPRLNAAGRISHGIDALRLLCTNNAKQGEEIAKSLNEINLERQATTDEIFLNADEEVKKIIGKKLIVCYGEGFHEGVIGLVAQKLTQKYFLPAIVISVNGENCKASARSVPGFDLTSFLRKIKGVFGSVGGHKAAAGFSLKSDKLQKFIKQAQDLAEKEIDPKLLLPFVEVDTEIPLGLVKANLLALIKQMEPFGLGNPTPVFYSTQVKVCGFSRFGKASNHLKIVLCDGENSNFKIVGKVFNGAENHYDKLSLGQNVSVAYSISENTFNGKTAIETTIKDLKIE